MLLNIPHHEAREVVYLKAVETGLITKNLSRHISLTEQEKSLFFSKIHEQQVKKKSFLLQQGNPCHFIHFVNTGILRAYHQDTSGKESTIMFATKDWWITDMHCFLNRLPAMVNIQVVEDCSIFKLSLHDLNTLYEQIPAFNTFFRILMQNAYCREQLRMIQNLSVPAKERYQHFITKYPFIASAVPLKYIASYLGITPEFLSTIRAQKD